MNALLFVALTSATCDASVGERISHLGDYGYACRQRAHNGIRHCGEMARMRLLAVRTSDLEVSTRVWRLLADLDNDHYEHSVRAVDRLFDGRFPYLPSLWYAPNEGGCPCSAEWTSRNALDWLIRKRMERYLDLAWYPNLMPPGPTIVPLKGAPKHWHRWQQASRMFAIEVVARRRMPLERVDALFQWLHTIDDIVLHHWQRICSCAPGHGR